jgi:hypothetical protein
MLDVWLSEMDTTHGALRLLLGSTIGVLVRLLLRFRDGARHDGDGDVALRSRGFSD